jgi:small G protein signaling modulator 3
MRLEHKLSRPVFSNTMTASEEGSILSRRSSSQTSRISSESKNAKGTASQPRRSLSKSSATPSHKPDPSLTSFPSFSPEQIGPQEKAPKQDPNPKALRTFSQKARERKATLAGLTSASPTLSHQNALFDDSPRPSLDIPGALHLASDEHISRLIARAGAIKLVRQFAQDLAQRDAEMTALRIRADNRERELKKLLREVDVGSAEIEKRLLRLDHMPDHEIPTERPLDMSSRESANIHGMMQEAMSAEVGLEMDVVESPPSSPTQPVKSTALPSSDRHGCISGMLSNSGASSSKTSKTSSIVSQDRSDADATLKPRVSSSKGSRLRGLEDIFQPSGQSTSYFIGGASKTIKKSKASDTASVRSNQSSSSFASWTKLFGGNPKTGKGDGGRPRSSSVEQGSTTQTLKVAPGSAFASLSKVRTNPTASASKPRAALAVSGTAKTRPTARRTVTASRLPTGPTQVRMESNATDFPPTVEMDSMIESSQLPPTMKTYNHEVEGLLTDRFGFIYDQRQRKRQNAALLKHNKNKLSGAETLGSFRSDRSEGEDSPVADGKLSNGLSTPAEEETSNSKKSWQDYLKVSSTVNMGHPRELLSHTPSAGAVVTVSTADGTITPPSQTRSASISISVSAQKALPTSSVVSEPTQSTITVTSTDAAGQTQDIDMEAATNASDKEPVRLLLEQLKELHDTLQAEKTVKWNDFLRRVRAERATATDRGTKNAPEAELLNGELIGIATLGRSSKTKSKYMHFKALVLAGIPVSLRPKIWAECSLASTMRIPGYYDDLVTRSDLGGDIDPDIASQIKADIRRTLTDNTFFRYGPGVQRLEELLRAYSLHNPRIGYCQGMNLITASLLLICATPEDCFWLLVAIIDQILPSGYFDQSLLVARADQIVLRGYVAEVLPKLDAKLQELGVELEACTFHWFLSLYTGVLTGGEALYRVWDVVICLHSQQDAPANALNSNKMLSVDVPGLSQPTSPVAAIANENTNNEAEHDGTSSPFLFQLSLALLKLNESAILNLESAAQVYSYINHNMTNHAIGIDSLIYAAEGISQRVQRADVLERRRRAVQELEGGGDGE